MKHLDVTIRSLALCLNKLQVEPIKSAIVWYGCLSLVGIETLYKIWTAVLRRGIKYGLRNKPLTYVVKWDLIFSPFLDTLYVILKGTRSNIWYCHFLKLFPFSFIQNKAKINPLWPIVHAIWIPSFERNYMFCSLIYNCTVFFCGLYKKWTYFILLQNWKWSRMHQVSVDFYRRFLPFYLKV